MSYRWCRAYLAFINSRVFSLWISYSEPPVLSVRGMRCLEPLIRCVRVSPNRQQMNVSVPHPGNLQMKQILFVRV